MDEQQLAALFGPAAAFSEYQAGDTITFRDSRGQEITDEIWHVCAPQPATETRAAVPTLYIMRSADPASGMPYMVYGSEIIV